MVSGKELVDLYFGFSTVSNDVNSAIAVAITYRGWNNEKHTDMYMYSYRQALCLDNEKVDKFRYVPS